MSMPDKEYNVLLDIELKKEDFILFSLRHIYTLFKLLKLNRTLPAKHGGISPRAAPAAYHQYNVQLINLYFKNLNQLK